MPFNIVQMVASLKKASLKMTSFSMLLKIRTKVIYPRVLRRDICITVLAPTPLTPIQSGQATNMSANSEIIPSMGKAPTPLPMAKNTWVNTKMANPMGMANPLLQVARNTLVNTKMVNPTGKAHTPILMEEEMLVHSKMAF